MTTEPPAQQPETPASLSTLTRSTPLLVTVVVLVVSVVGAVAFLALQSHRPALGSASVGDCVAGVSEGKALTEARRAECSDSSVIYKVLDKVSSETDCLKVAGTEATVPTDANGEQYLCLMAKNADASQGVNTLRAGSCLIDDASDPSGIRKSDCVPGSYPVQAVLTNSKGLTSRNTLDKCAAAGASSPERFYEWSMLRYGDSTVSITTDMVLCLGAVN
ncbi:hypothetical protein [uncultured Actinomyces sp.]|uniref:LppU/SCO3897 family protein n=1 Tax=uncultured Actinomyces sp. TaxID=249061 RepID=UPI00262781A9|nr:hypothetical protein [uncultured Actinomyces sp.]